ncbi:putative hydroxymethylpyrimidine transporter CytX [Sporobacter termitidis DSM 10068]|uniref:Putative hydroxymethylpyrimidine transporter CytX n=1 Tax=Sporobacter termitidis DSM 10068 TaxID=1123282 RepID=A0A1M5U6H3_9FIRM|nr:putative hydroxymethylpyrimidine transporter CytX [Sporobacter termitidis]SHH58491.1 putative hydroxymethylpyrimidine transporter CytX [Sporobacter termitidis DSM 10068]
MENKKTSVFENGLIWFGAAVSIAEIMAGTYFAPLGLAKGLMAILLGHLIGCALFFFAGLIGANTGKSAMETVKISFGQKGAILFSGLNVLQLVGWTAIMIVVGAASAGLILPSVGGWFWCVVIGALILVWVLIGVKNLSKVNLIAMAALFILSVILSITVFGGQAGASAMPDITFGRAVELAVTMPLSWLPLVSDYTRYAKRKTAVPLASSLVYFFTSSWMYLIGLGVAMFAAGTDIGQLLLDAGLGVAGLLIVVFSTVTTAFLDAFSAGVSAVSIAGRLDEKKTAAAVCVVGTVLAIFTPITRFEDFLYLIGSVFAPMISILIVDVFLLRHDASGSAVSVKNLIIWAVGFAAYRLSMQLDTPVGNTLPVMLVTGLLCLIVYKIGGKNNARNNAQ